MNYKLYIIFYYIYVLILVEKPKEQPKGRMEEPGKEMEPGKGMEAGKGIDAGKGMELGKDRGKEDIVSHYHHYYFLQCHSD